MEEVTVSKRRVFQFLMFGLLVVVALVLFVQSGVTTSNNGGPSLAGFSKMRSDPDSNSQAVVGNQGEKERDVDSAADEEYAHRAYPETEIPLELTLNAQAGFIEVQARGVGQGKNTPGQWTLAGPSTANYPAVLTFSGHDYTTSGRITALAIAPGCSSNNCRLWVGAAGGGVWRTDNALSGAGPNWTFVSGSFATNAIGTLFYDAAHNTLYAGTGESHASGDSEAGLGIFK